MRALADVMKLARQAQHIQALEALVELQSARICEQDDENDALLKYASELIDRCVALKQSETEWKIRAAESRRRRV